MEEGKKETTLAVETRKLDSPIDANGFGNDFLASWKLTTEEKEDLDFTTERTPQRQRKKAFDFGKLDDFELGDDFAKISSFKMDMSDIDFSSPEGVADKPRGKPNAESTSRKIDIKQDAFSFNFDFNELEGFGLESNLLNVKKDSKPVSNEADLSSKCEKNSDFGKEPDFSNSGATDDSKMLAESSKVETSESPHSEAKGTIVAKINESATGKTMGYTKGESIPKKAGGKNDAFSFNFNFNESENLDVAQSQPKLSTGTPLKNKGLDLLCKNHVNLDSGRKLEVRGLDLTNNDSNKSQKSPVVNSDESSMEAPHAVVRETSAPKINEVEGNESSIQRKQLQLSGLKNICDRGSLGDDSLKKQLELTSLRKLSAKFVTDATCDNKSVLQISKKLFSDVNNGESEKTIAGSEELFSAPHKSGLERSSGTCIEKSDVKVTHMKHIRHPSFTASGNTTKQLAHGGVMEEELLPSTLPTTGASSEPNCEMQKNATNQVLNRLNRGDELKGSSSTRIFHEICTYPRESTSKKMEPKCVKESARNFVDEGGILQLNLKSSLKKEATKSIFPSFPLLKAIRNLSEHKIEKLASIPANETSGAIEALSKPLDGEVCKQLPAGLRPDCGQENNPQVQSQSSILSEVKHSSGIRQTKHSKISGFSDNKLFKISTFEKHERPAKINEICLQDKLVMSSLKESSCKSDISGKQELHQAGTFIVKSEMNSVLTLASSANKTKCTLLSSPSKRKSLELPIVEVASLNPFKRLSVSASKRTSFETTLGSDDLHNNVQEKSQRELSIIDASICEPMTDIKESPQIGNYDNGKKEDSYAKEPDNENGIFQQMANYDYGKKAESYAKELDNLCSMLKKKNDEAKELLVRAVINGNSLLLLNDPIYIEKIRSFQMFASNLLAKNVKSETHSATMCADPPSPLSN